MKLETATSIKGIQSDWPFDVDLVPVSKLFADTKYQRPPLEPFIERLVREFDETLVGAIDVSARSDGRYAILDGLQRFSAVKKVGKATVHCSIYRGMTLAEEAEFFVKKNRDRRSVHPYYTFRARLVSGEKAVKQIDRIVRKHGFKLGVGAGPDDVITAIRAVEDSHAYTSVPRPRGALDPALQTIRESFFGRKGAKEGEIIRGLGRFWQAFYDEEVDYGLLLDKLAAVGPLTIIGRAKDRLVGKRGHSAGYEVAREVVKVYNTGLKQGKLAERMLSGK
jgi:hypothetical protein